MTKRKLLIIHVLVYVLSSRALGAGFRHRVNEDSALRPCGRGSTNIIAKCDPNGSDHSSVSLHRRDDREDQEDILDELDHYPISETKFDEISKNGMERLDRHQLRQESGAPDIATPRAEVKLNYTISPTAEVLPCPDYVQRFYELIGIEGPPGAAEPSYQEFKYSPANVINMGTSVGARATVRASIYERHIIVEWEGQAGGWMDRTKEYDTFEIDYHKVLFSSWDMARVKAMTADGSKNIYDPRYQLDFITIARIRNPDTVRILAEILRRRNLVFDDLFEIHAVDSIRGSRNFILWAALIGTPEIGAVLEMLSDWPDQFRRSVLHAVRFHLQTIGSGTELEGTISVSIAPPPVNRGITGTAEVKVFVDVGLIEISQDVVTYPGAEAFGSLSSWVTRLDHIEFRRGDSRKEPGEEKSRAVENASFRKLSFEWLFLGQAFTGKIETYVSGQEQHLVISSELPHLHPEAVRDILYQIWNRGVGSNSPLSYITFLRLTPKSVEIAREIFQAKDVGLEDGAVLTIWPSRNQWEGGIEILNRQDNEWEDEKTDMRIFKETLSECLEYLALRAILTNKAMWWWLGRPAIQAVEISYRTRGSSPDGVVFAMFIRLAGSASGSGLRSTAHAEHRRKVPIHGLESRKGRAGVYRFSQQAENNIVAPQEGYFGYDKEITAAEMRDMKTAYTKGLKELTAVFEAAVRGEARTAPSPDDLIQLLEEYKITFQNGHSIDEKVDRLFPKAQIPPALQSLIDSYGILSGGVLPPAFRSAAHAASFLYDNVSIQVGSANEDSYPYVFIQSTPTNSLAITNLPEANEAGEIPALSHALYLSWYLAGEPPGGPSETDPEVKSLDYIFILKISSQSTNIIRGLLRFHGISLVGRSVIRLVVREHIPSVASLMTPFAESGRFLGILGGVLGIPEILAVQEMTRVYQGYPSIDGRVILEVIVEWEFDTAKIFVILGDLERGFDGTWLKEELDISKEEGR
ncbi:hypothetical protein TWF718_009884 [Orbilia javanica]|uniref:Uncharacterized protein n=1 Tax=Orbilia javanica TaxID=47235 RepID=A0AAN8MQG0_9PEZI